MSKEQVSDLNIYIEKLKNQSHNPSKKHDTPTKQEAYKKFIDIEITKAQQKIERLKG